MPSVEIVTSAFAMPKLEAFKALGAPSLIADNACRGCLVLGDELTSKNDSVTFSTDLNSPEDLHFRSKW